MKYLTFKFLIQRFNSKTQKEGNPEHQHISLFSNVNILYTRPHAIISQPDSIYFTTLMVFIAS